MPQPEDSISTLPLACSPSQTTFVSGSSRVMRISPNSPRWRASASASLSSFQSSGGDFTSRRCACTWGIGGTIRPCRAAVLRMQAIFQPGLTSIRYTTKRSTTPTAGMSTFGSRIFAR